MFSLKQSATAALVPAVVLWASIACAQRRERVAEQRVLLSACDTVSRVQSRIPAGMPVASAVAVGTSTVVGTVRDRQTGAALAGVVLRFQGKQPRNARTDSAGGFLLERLTPGAYHVLVTRIGYDVARDTLRLAVGAVDTLDYKLQYRSCS